MKGWPYPGRRRTIKGMKVEMLVVPGCPHESAAAEVLTAALRDIGLGALGYTVRVIDSQDTAEQRHFVGSPTICMDGLDIFAEPDRPAALACRIYPGGTGVPELRDLRQALKEAAAVSTSR